MKKNEKRILFYSSDRSGTINVNDSASYHFSLYPYSIGAIRFNLESLGWQTCYAPLSLTKNPIQTCRLINSFKPSIVYTYGSLTALNPILVRPFCTHNDFKVVHGWDDVYGEIWADVFGFPFGYFMNWFEKRIIKNSDAVVTLSRYNQIRGQKWGVKSGYIPNGADIPVVDLKHSKIKLEGHFNLVYTGDATRWKRTYEICEAMRHLPSEIKLYITGAPNPDLSKFFSPNCIYLGYLPKYEQLNVMAQADVLVVTANQDCNAKLQEYLRFKKPILGYDGRLNLFFTNGQNALLTKDYPTAIRKLVADIDFCKKLAERAASEIPVFSWKEIASMYDNFFTQLFQVK